MRLSPHSLVLAAATCLVGCARGPLVVESVRPVDAVDSAHAPILLPDAYPLDAPERTYVVERGPDAGKSLRRAFTRRDDGLIELRETLLETGEVVAIVVLSTDEAGGVVVHETGRPRRDLLTRFDPPMLFAPHGLAPGESTTQTLRVTTHPMSDPSRVRDRGEGTLELSRAEDRVEVGGEGVAFATITSTLRLRLGIASVESVSVYSLSERGSSDAGGSALAGLRARSSAREVRVFGIVAEREEESIR